MHENESEDDDQNSNSPEEGDNDNDEEEENATEVSENQTEMNSEWCASNQSNQQKENDETINEQLTRTENKTITLINRTLNGNIPKVSINNNNNKTKTNITCEPVKNSDANWSKLTKELIALQPAVTQQTMNIETEGRRAAIEARKRTQEIYHREKEDNRIYKRRNRSTNSAPTALDTSHPNTSPADPIRVTSGEGDATAGPSRDEKEEVK